MRDFTITDQAVRSLVPSGVVWCGACGGGTNRMTPEEGAAFLGAVVALVADGHDPLAVLDALAGPLEVIGRAKTLPCQCDPAPPVVPRSGFHLYRLWTADRRLLYVGVSVRLRDRLRAHRRRWPDLWTDATWAEYPDETAMLAAEAEAIRDEDPAMNAAGVR